MSFGIPLRSGVLVGVASIATLGSLSRTPINDFRVAMPAGASYSRTGAGTGLTTAGVLQSFAANAPQRTDRGLALEPARTNLALSSLDASSIEWSTTLITKTTGQADPFGGTGAALMTSTGVSAAHFALTSAITLTAYVSGTTYTLSRIVKKGTQSLLQLTGPGGGFGASQYANFDLDAGTALGFGGIVGSPEIISVGNGWYQIAITVTATATVSSNTGATVFISSGADTRLPTTATTTTFFDFGAQAVEATTATSVISTAAAPATRGLPVFTETVPAGRTKALLSYADGTTTQTTGLTPGGTFDVATAVIGANKGRFGVSELVTRAWYP